MYLTNICCSKVFCKAKKMSRFENELCVEVPAQVFPSGQLQAFERSKCASVQQMH